MTKRTDAHRAADARYNAKRQGVRLNAYIPEETAEKLDDLAEKHGTRTAAVIAAIDNEWIKK